MACARGPIPSSEPVPPAVPETTSAAPGDPAQAPMRIVEVAPGVFAVLQPAPLRFYDANGALVVTDEGLVAIDGPQRWAAGRWVIGQALAVTQGPRRVLVTTHWHADHSVMAEWWSLALRERGESFERWGHAGLASQLASEGQAQVEERRDAVRGMIERGTTMQTEGRRSDGTPLTADERAQLDGELVELRAESDALEGLVLQPPTHVVSETTTLTLGSLTLELIPLRAHTDADVVIHLPQTGVLITGDVLDEIPFGGHGRPRKWLAALQRLRSLHPTAIIPGHGAVLGPEHLDAMIELWEALLGQAMLAIQRGEEPGQRYAEWAATPEHQALRQRLVTDPVGERAFDRFMPEALDRAMADLRGDLDPPPHE